MKGKHDGQLELMAGHSVGKAFRAEELLYNLVTGIVAVVRNLYGQSMLDLWTELFSRVYWWG